MISAGPVKLEVNEGLTKEQLELKQQYIDAMIGDQFPKVHYGPGYVPANSTLNEFITMIANLIVEDQKDMNPKIMFLDKFSKINMFEYLDGKDVRGAIAYRLLRQQPSSTAQTNAPFSDERKEIRPRLRAVTYGEIDKPGEVTFHFGQFIVSQIEFTIYARSNTEANDIVDWFENIMEKNRQFFAYYGIMKYYFLERDSDAIIREGDGVVHVRPMSYWVRTEKTFEQTEQAINNIIVKIKTA